MSKQVGEKLWVHKCNRCGYEWASRVENPAGCPGCSTPYWNKPRIRNVADSKKQKPFKKEVRPHGK